MLAESLVRGSEKLYGTMEVPRVVRANEDFPGHALTGHRKPAGSNARFRLSEIVDNGSHDDDPHTLLVAVLAGGSYATIVAPDSRKCVRKPRVNRLVAATAAATPAAQGKANTAT